MLEYERVYSPADFELNLSYIYFLSYGSFSLQECEAFGHCSSTLTSKNRAIFIVKCSFSLVIL